MDNKNKCTKCGKEILLNPNTHSAVHAGGGDVEQRCNNCNWKGGQVGKFSACPRCGDGTRLVDDHTASI